MSAPVCGLFIGVILGVSWCDVLGFFCGRGASSPSHYVILRGTATPSPLIRPPSPLSLTAAANTHHFNRIKNSLPLLSNRTKLFNKLFSFVSFNSGSCSNGDVGLSDGFDWLKHQSEMKLNSGRGLAVKDGSHSDGGRGE